MSRIPSSSYSIHKPHPDQLITLPDGRDEVPALLLPLDDNPREQEWKVERTRDGGCTISNTETGKYLGFEGDPCENKQIGAAGKPKE
ncbi:hypothetical protein BOTBODRAFT_176304 [Botryobasidium botryosum FD-172 SS1]|uniref:Ricin B lectin domain-containing protein n=1 Tax=Botryobasidium botryosum (strain FD-172 SS1) TaxID=930990 RepID=A0A067MD38_BOTB1|nr:hypothetical protein BOTBODRAFT_176304 [Botryobasidium botryosum FD-172 SS1]